MKEKKINKILIKLGGYLMSGIMDELDRMEELITAATVAPVSDIPEMSTDAPSTESPSTEIPDDFSTELPSTESPNTEAPTTEVPEDDELTRLRNELFELRESMKKSPKTSSPSTKAPSTLPPIEDVDFIIDIDIEDLTSDPAELNKVLNSIYKRAIATAREEILSTNQSISKTLPDIVSKNIEMFNELKTFTDNFYQENSDLAKFKGAVKTVYDEMAASSNKPYTEIMEDVAIETRKRLGLTKAPKQTDKPPRLPTKKAQKRGTPNKQKSDPLLAQLDAMDEALNS